MSAGGHRKEGGIISQLPKSRGVMNTDVWFLETFLSRQEQQCKPWTCEGARTSGQLAALELSPLLLIGFGIFSVLAAYCNILRCSEHNCNGNTLFSSA